MSDDYNGTDDFAKSLDIGYAAIRERVAAGGKGWEPMKYHALANIFPLLDGVEFEQLVEDVRTHGVREPIWIYEGEILDGRNRHRASVVAGVDCPMREYLDDDPIGFVVSLNLKRRHLDESQRAMVAAKLATLKDGQRADEVAGTSIEVAAGLLNVGRASVERAKVVQRDGAAELQQAVERGAVSVSAAADVATRPTEEQTEIVARGEKAILEAAKQIRAEKAAASRIVRLDNLARISAGNAELGTETKYPIIYADPPWRYENPPIGGSNRSIENHYPTMTLEEICALPVADLATDDALLYLWATSPKLAECMKVIEAWGFEYRTDMIWDKEVIGMGYHARNQHETLLIAKRGNIPPPAPGTQPSSVYREKRGDHSEKPDFYYEMIEAAYPQLPKIELFLRGAARPGWKGWGNQSEGRLETA